MKWLKCNIQAYDAIKRAERNRQISLILNP